MALIMNLFSEEHKFVDELGNLQFNHFSHRHPLELTQVHADDKAVCSGCEHDISGPAYMCSKPNCTFLLHDLCFDLPRQIRHHSHPKHPLALRYSPPYHDGEFTCDACGNSGHAFTYHCVDCKFDLHVACASLPEIEVRKDHKHPLLLSCGFPDGYGDDSVYCYVCDDLMAKSSWIYCCSACKCGAHLECAGVIPQSQTPAK